MARNDYGVNFDGRRIVHPGGYDAMDATAMVSITPGSLNLPIVVGEADAGESGKVHYFTSATDARKYLRGGALVKALELMFSPTPEGGGGASIVGVIITNATEQADASNGGVLHTAREYGEGGNRITVKIESGTITGSKRYTATRWDLNALEVFNNIGAVIKVRYTGAQSYAGVIVTASGGAATTITTKIGTTQGTSVTDLLIDLTNPRFATVDDVVSFINSNSGYTASLVSTDSSGLASSKLDELLEVDIKAADTYLLGIAGDLEYRVNNKSQLVNVSVTGSVANATASYLTGGTKGTSPNSWADYFGLVKREFSDILVVLSDSSSIHAEALSHIGEMENRNQKQVLFTGGAVGETAEEVKLRAAALSNSRAVLAYPGIYHISHEGGKVALPPYFTAAMLAGRVAGVPASEPITFDYFSVLGLEVDLLAGDPVVDDLITSGVATVERVQNGGFRLVQGITTYLASNNTLYREISVRRGADKLSESARKTLEQTFVGKKGVRTTVASVTTKMVEILEQAMRDGEITAYKNIVVRFTGGVVYVDYQVAPTEPINYVLVTTHFVPESL